MTTTNCRPSPPFTTSQVAGRAAELYAYGTAMVVEAEQVGEVGVTIDPAETFATPDPEG